MSYLSLTEQQIKDIQWYTDCSCPDLGNLNELEPEQFESGDKALIISDGCELEPDEAAQLVRGAKHLQQFSKSLSLLALKDKAKVERMIAVIGKHAQQASLF